MGKKNKLVIATRGSKLALWQANWVKIRLEKKYAGIKIELKKIKTTGDKILDVPLAKIGGKGLFLKEIEDTLLRKGADLAVHSMKDVPVDLPGGLHLIAVCKREDPRDALITAVSSQQSVVSSQKNSESQTLSSKLNPSLVTRRSLLYDLPRGAAVGTSSLRRTCQLLSIRPDIKITQLRGNLDTRIRKLDEGLFDAIVVAAAGVKRLGLADRITEIIPSDISLPAIGQGAIGIECRVEDEDINSLLRFFDHPETSVCVRAERAFLKKLEGGCQVPIAAYARIISQKSEVRSQKSESKSKLKTQDSKLNSSLVPRPSLLIMDGLVGSVSGDRIIRGSIKGKPEEAEKLGIKLAEDLISKGAGEILAEVYKKESREGVK